MADITVNLAEFLKEKRKEANLTQPALAAKAGVGLRFVRELEQGKTTLKMDKVNQVLKLFGQELGPVPLNRKTLLNEERLDVLMNGKLAGQLSETEAGYVFLYDENYLQQSNAQAVSLTLPLTNKPYSNNTMLPFFDGLIPEGWLLDVAEHNWKLDARDRMGLLLACCKDCIGAVSIVENQNQ